MSWLPIILLAAAAFAVAAFALRLPKRAWTTFAAVLVFGLAGYATQGRPGLPDAPRSAAAELASEGELLVKARRDMFDPAQPPAGFLTVSDAFARRGKYEEAAKILRSGLAKDPDYAEGWLAYANALVEHAGGRISPAAIEAYTRAQTLAPNHPGATYFLGVALIRSGQVAEARALWAALLERAPADAPWRPELEGRIARLDDMIAQMRAAGE